MLNPKTLLLASLVATAASASDDRSFSDLPLSMMTPLGHFQVDTGWRFGLGAGVESEPEYHGAEDNETEFDIYLEGAYRGERWDFTSSISDNYLTYQIASNWFLQGWINFEEGREESDFDALEGLGDIDDSVEWGGAVAWLPIDRLTLALAAQTYTSGDPDKGTVGFFAANYRAFSNEKWAVDLAADVSYGDSDHLQTEFGITDEQAENSVYDSYDISGGLKSYGIAVRAAYKFSDHFYLTGALGYEKYDSEIADSPLLKAGSDSEVEAEVVIIYKF